MASESKLDHPPDSTTTTITTTTVSDLPPESFWVPINDEDDWLSRNAVMQRKTSLKIGYHRNFNKTTSFSHHDAPSSARRSSRPSVVFGLPKAEIKKPAPARSLFRSRSEPGVKPAGFVPEPGSPRVSCTGRVGSFRSSGSDGKKTGFTRLFGSLFRSRSGKTRPSRGTGNAR